jgi:hypothetical protein
MSLTGPCYKEAWQQQQAIHSCTCCLFFASAAEKLQQQWQVYQISNLTTLSSSGVLYESGATAWCCWSARAALQLQLQCVSSGTLCLLSHAGPYPSLALQPGKLVLFGMV